MKSPTDSSNEPTVSSYPRFRLLRWATSFFRRTLVRLVDSAKYAEIVNLRAECASEIDQNNCEWREHCEKLSARNAAELRAVNANSNYELDRLRREVSELSSRLHITGMERDMCIAVIQRDRERVASETSLLSRAVAENTVAAGGLPTSTSQSL